MDPLENSALTESLNFKERERLLEAQLATAKELKKEKEKEEDSIFWRY